eukprot:2062274-Prymnesium_polylepis.1
MARSMALTRPSSVLASDCLRMLPPLPLRWHRGESLASGTPTRRTSLRLSNWASLWSSDAPS